MNEKFIVFFTAHKFRGVRVEDGYILYAKGAKAERELRDVGSTSTDDYPFVHDELPVGPCISIWEGEITDDDGLDEPKYEGKWRDATADDLRAARLII
jgi:hypothetical protein